MKMKKAIIISATLLSFLLITVTALAMKPSSEKTVNDEPQSVQNSTEVYADSTPSIVKSAVLPKSPAVSNENDGQVLGEEPQLAQSYTEAYTETNPNGTPSIVKSAVLPGSSAISNENDGQVLGEEKPQLSQSYTESNQNVMK